MPKSRKKILFAAGGSGGHLFPAQALGHQLLEKDPGLEIFFAAAKLSESAYFDRKQFPFCDISSTTPFRGGLLQSIRSIGILAKGVKESLELLKKQKPDLVVGFGSFHSFPVICAAALKRIPIVLFESNAIPGKVVRLFSKRAQFTGVYFPEAKKHLKGKIVEVEIPKRNSLEILRPEEARAQFSLKTNCPTLLVFGGSQGAKGINRQMLTLMPLLKEKVGSFQLIHFTGNSAITAEMQTLCGNLNIPCYVKDFEPRMQIAWSAADAVLCRAGAMTLSELLHYEVPGVLVPYPYAADQHQLKNALFVQKSVGAVETLQEDALNVEQITEAIAPLLEPSSLLRLQKKEAIKRYKAQQIKNDLIHLILEAL